MHAVATEERYYSPPSAPKPAQDSLKRFLSSISLPSLYQLIRQESHWFLLAIPLLLTMLSPLQWLNGKWSILTAPLGFQPLVLFGSLYLGWAEREAVFVNYTQLAGMFPPESKMRRGTPIFVYAGCLLLILSYITTLPTVAIAGFITLLAGIIFYIYGFPILSLLWRPFLFALLMIPLPGSLSNKLSSFMELGNTSAAGAVLKLFSSTTYTVGNFVSMNSYTISLDGSCTGVGILFPVLALTLFIALLRQIRWTITLILLGCAAGIALATNLARILVMVAIGSQNASLSHQLHDANSWLFVALSFLLVLPIIRWIGPRTYYFEPEPEEEPQQ